ncbi:MAG: MBL fold metallo-hydrolase, partial [Metallosphaera sp.]
VKLMEGFHRRYIPSKLAIEKWLNRIRGMDIHIIAPQHGSIFMEKDVKKFLDWLGSLDKVGLDLL